MNKIFRLPEDISPQARSAFLFSVIVAGVNLMVALYWLYTGITTGATQFYVLSSLVVVQSVLPVFGAILSRRGHPTLGILLVLGVLLVLYPYSATLVSGLGLIIGFGLMGAGPILAFPVLTRRQAWGMTFLSVASGAAAVLLDIFGSPTRPSLPGIFIPMLVVGGVGLLGYLLVRQAWGGGLRTKLLIAFIGTTVIATGALSAFVIITTTNNLRANLERELSGLAASHAAQVGDLFNEQISKIVVLSVDETLQRAVIEQNQSYQGDAAAIQADLNAKDAQWLAADAANDNADPLVHSRLTNPAAFDLVEYQDAFPDNVEVFITDIHGGLVSTTNRTSDYNQADEIWWQTTYNNGIGKTYISSPQFDKSTKEPGIQFAVPLRDRETGKVIGILRTTYVMTSLTTILTQGVGESSAADIFIPGQTATHIHQGVFEAIDPRVFEQLQAVAGQNMVEMDYEGALSVVSQAKISSRDKNPVVDGLGWVVVFHQSQNEAFAPVNAQVQGIIVVIVIVIFFAVLAAILIAQALVRPLTELTDAAQEIASGNLLTQARIISNDEIGVLAKTFNSMTFQLRQILLGLEERVAERTRNLELASEVGRTVTEKVENLPDLLAQSVELIRSRFNLYYTQIYLADASGHNLNLQAGTGNVGYELLRRKHRLSISSGSLNGRAATDRMAMIVADTLKSSDFLPNPLLPLTRSEMAVPLIVNGKVLGVLDMQSEQPDTFSEANLPAFQVLAGQLGIAIQNATLFQMAEEARLEVVAQASRLTTAGWQDFLNAVDRNEMIGFVYDQNAVQPLLETPGPVVGNTLAMPIQVSGADIGEVRLTDQADRQWTPSERQIVRAIVTRVAQHVENLRLLEQAERYRAEAEQVSRRLTSEGWNEFLKTRHELAAGYIYTQNRVQPLPSQPNKTGILSPTISQSLVVHDQAIGELRIDADTQENSYAATLVASVTQQLSEHIENLRLLEQAEQRRLEADGLTHQLEERAHQLETVATLSTTASTVLDPDLLLDDVVNLTKERFGLYHAHIYLADSEGETLLLGSGAGEVGRQMVAAKHSISMRDRHSLVVRAAREQKPIIVADVQSEPGFVVNPLLPDVCSEMAVPMIIGDSVIGVFDVQSAHLAGFSKEDSSVYTTLAAQVAVALQNARLYVEQANTVAQLRELDRLKSSFLANMSHELRTPLNSILGFSDVMLEGLDGDLTENMENDLGLIRKNGQHLLNLINDVLDMAKIESGTMSLHPEMVLVHDVLDEVRSITSTFASQRHIALFIKDSSDQDVEIYVDRTRLRQVMINLVNNSIKFTEQGKISIDAQKIAGEKLLITVKDTGIGIPADKLESIFKEFTQVDVSSTRKIGGTGLGLPISRKLVEMHGGRLWAESSGVHGEGSTFYVELPLKAHIAEK